MATGKFIGFLRPIIIIIIIITIWQHKVLAAYSTDISFQAPTWKASFACILNKATDKKYDLIKQYMYMKVPYNHGT